MPATGSSFPPPTGAQPPAIRSPVGAVVVAAGRGRRFGEPLAKQFQPLAGATVLRQAVLALRAHPAIGPIQVVIGPDDRALADLALRGLRLPAPVVGGETRQDSVRLGLDALATEGAPELVLIHDAARPLVSTAVIGRVIDALGSDAAVLPAVAVADTLKRGRDGRVIETVPRDGLYRAQTPQGFHFDAIRAAHHAAIDAGATDLTDDAAIAERAGLAVRLVEGCEDNLKITTRGDLTRAEAVLRLRAMAFSAPLAAPADLGPTWVPRVGKGFDVHAFEPGDAVFLCGVRVPHSAKLLGHSDADVGLHALTDALLGAIAAGDIGAHFPPTDPRWRGADSVIFLEHALDLVRVAGGRLVHVDVTLICERPKIRPHHAAMVARLVDLLGLPEGSVSVKATTTERLGFTGREEGIAAEAVATVLMPA